MSKSLQKGKGGSPDKLAKLQDKIAALGEQVLGAGPLPRLFHQLVIFVLDGSGSMTFDGITGKSKGEEVEDVVKSVLKRLHESKNENCFDVSMYAYARDFGVMIQQQRVESLEEAEMDLNPCSHVGDNRNTYLEEVMEAVELEADEYLAESGSSRTEVLIILLSDGLIHDLNDVMPSIDKIHGNDRVHLSTIFVEDSGLLGEDFEVDWQEASDTLRDLASNAEEHVVSSFDPEEIRKQMIKSISLVSKRLGA